MLFYVEHVLKGGKLQAGLILLTYFIAGAASVPLWLLLSKRLSKAAAWFIGMVLTAIAMSCAIFIGPGDFYWFLAISVITGMGIGADYGLTCGRMVRRKSSRESSPMSHVTRVTTSQAAACWPSRQGAGD